ncbi:DUF6286 domain-containing protein [Streptomyces fagopyri]|uniref:DUF6286 domain-containing protein n=1 Tax=Streptomyces fagopyri TaxID=2662397 RepID=UPI0037138D39
MTVPFARRGTTTVSDKAVRRIAERAAREALPGRPASAPHVSAAVHGRRAHVSLGVALPYPLPVAETARQVRRYVSERTRELTGLDVSLRRISVDTLTGPSGAPVPAGAVSRTVPLPEGGARRVPRRRWSQRRAPMAAVTLAGAVTCGAVAFDTIQARTAHRPAAAWRTGTLDRLSGHGPGDTPVVLIGAGLALFGLWLTVLAVTSGRRRLLTLSAPGTGLDATADRAAVAASVRDAVAEVAGIGPADVRVRRRRVAVRAGLAFGDQATAHADVTAATRRTLAGWRPRRAPRVRIMVRTEPVRQPTRPEAEGPPRPTPVATAYTLGEEVEG